MCWIAETIVIADDSCAPRHRRHHGRHGHRQLRGHQECLHRIRLCSIPARIARAGRKLGIISDARYRFERGVDPQFVLPGWNFAPG